MIRTFVLTSYRCLKLTPNPTLPPSTRLDHVQALTHVREYTRVICALIPNTPIAPFYETTRILRHLHPFAKVDIPPFYR
jgi:hypothetical protein